jgi:hypothetical protein
MFPAEQSSIEYEMDVLGFSYNLRFAKELEKSSLETFQTGQ